MEIEDYEFNRLLDHYNIHPEVTYDTTSVTGRLFSDDERAAGVNATRLVVRAIELRILDIDNLEPDEE